MKNPWWKLVVFAAAVPVLLTAVAWAEHTARVQKARRRVAKLAEYDPHQCYKCGRKDGLRPDSYLCYRCYQEVMEGEVGCYTGESWDR